MTMSPDNMEKTLQFLLALMPEETLSLYDNMMASGDTPIAADAKAGSDASNPAWLKMRPDQRNILRSLAATGHKPGMPLNEIALDAAVAGRIGKPMLHSIPGFKSEENAFPDFREVMGIKDAPTLDDHGKLI